MSEHDDWKSGTVERTEGQNVASINKEIKYTYSNIVVAVFATVVLGELVDGEQIRDRTILDKLIVRLDNLGYLHQMHELGEFKDFRDMVDDMVNSERPWLECLATLCHITLFYFDGAEGLVAKRDAIRKRIDDEARSGCSRNEMISKLLAGLLGKKDTPTDEQNAPSSSSVN